jgi:hypothetical protein
MRLSRALQALSLLTALSTGIASADCSAGCPTLPAGSTSNVGTSSTTNNVSGTSNPTAAIVNSNENFQQQGQVQYGGGVACSDNSINPYIGNTNVGGVGYGYNAFTVGVGATIMVGPNHGKCAALADELLKQKQIDTQFGTANACIALAQHAKDFGQDPNAYIASAGLGGRCPTFTFAPPSVVVVPPAPAPQVITHETVYTEPCVNDPTAASDLQTLHDRRHELQTKHPSPEFVAALERVRHACGVTAQQIAEKEDG